MPRFPINSPLYLQEAKQILNVQDVNPDKVTQVCGPHAFDAPGRVVFTNTIFGL